MTVDMFERRFKQELGKLPLFVPDDNRDERVWKVDFPAWRALFTSLCFWGHSTGYRLPSFDQFFSYCQRAYCKAHPTPDRFRVYFSEPYSLGMKQRAKAWYESGMAETYLYACLVEAIEDKLKAGLVLYDARADWKLKADVIVLIHSQRLRINAFHGDLASRSRVEANRDKVERMRKQNTMESSHWNNQELATMRTLTIARDESDFQSINGVRVFSLQAINSLLERIFKEADIEAGFFFPVG